MSINDSVSPLHDSKETAKRTLQFGLGSLATGAAITINFYIHHMYLSGYIVNVFCISIFVLLFLNYKRVLKSIKVPIVLVVCFFLNLFALLEGVKSGQFLYFFPVLVIIPVIVNNSVGYNREVVSYFSITLFSAACCVLIGSYHQPWENISEKDMDYIFYSNIIFSLCLTTVFAFINIFSERKYLNDLVEQKNQVITTRTKFLSVMGHELRTPLNGIIGATNILKQEQKLPAQQEYIDILKYCADHMLHQVNDILDFNKIEAGQMEIHPVELNLKQLLLQSVIPFYNTFEEKSLELKVEIDPKLDVFVMADDVRLIQILNNLLSNALKFTEKGYVKLVVVCESKMNTQVQVGFSVEDTGAGIAEKDQKRIFDSFWQVYDESNRNYTGTGLGLNIALSLLNLMQSTLQVKSEVGKGSSFFFNIEFLLVAKPIANVPDVSRAKDYLSGLHILVVEDNQINMIIAKKVLTDYKATITMAYNGLEALNKLEQSADYQIILMDLEMPVLNGYTAIPIIKKLYPDIPVLAFTASLIDNEKLESIKGLGFADCVLKPFQPQQLIEQVRKYTQTFHDMAD